MRFYNQAGELDAIRHERTYAEELATALSAFDCVLDGEKALYASSELTTGKRLYDLMREVGVRDVESLKRKIGEEAYRLRLWEPNFAEALDFARQVRALSGGELVVTPAPLVVRGWTQPEYLSLWETAIRTRIKKLFFGPGWQYSNGCAFEFSVAWDAGLPACDAEGRPLDLEAGAALIAAAAAELESGGFDASGLRAILARFGPALYRTPAREGAS